MSFQSSLDSSPAAPYATLVTFTWGDGNVARYCRWTENISLGIEQFAHVPAMSVQLEKPLSGGTEDSPVKLIMPMDLPPVNALADVFPHARVRVKIEEIAPGDLLSRRTLFRGTVREVR